MKQEQLKKVVELYQEMNLLDKAKELLKDQLLNWDKHPDWQEGVARMMKLDPSFAPLIELDVKPETREDIIMYSFQYQKEWRFERERRLIEHALTLFPDWPYLHDRLEWHSRPVFHCDPSKSKTQPRKPLNLPRDPNYIPSQEALESLCFVTASGSDQPYFDLSIQLLESIKATRYYNHVPIKVLDCGLTKEDADYLRKRFGAEVKALAWSIDYTKIDDESNKGWNGSYNPNLNKWKGVFERPFIHEHFPGYEYYFWIDTDAWVQSENGIDQFLTITEKQGFCIAPEEEYIWSKTAANRHAFFYTISESFFKCIENKACLINDIYCMHIDFAKFFAQLTKEAMKEREKYLFGFELAMLNCAAYQYGVSDLMFPDSYCHTQKLYIDDQKALRHPLTHKISHFVGLEGPNKKGGYYKLFDPLKNPVFNRGELDIKLGQSSLEERLYQVILDSNFKKGNYFYRIYPDVYELYESQKKVLS